MALRRARRTSLRAAEAVAALIVFGTLAACGGSADPEPEREPLLTGVQLHPLWTGTTARDATRELDIARRAGVDVVRIDIGWSTLEQDAKGDISTGYSRRLDAFLEAARARGIGVIATLHETPCWASAAPAALRQGCRGEWWERGVARFPPRDPKDYADAAAYVARRWGDRMLAFEIWNEPNAGAFLESDDPVRDYARLVRAAYRPVKDARPELTVLAGSLIRADGDFLTQLYERGGIRGHYDAISYHPYTDDPTVAGPEDERESSLIRGTEWLHAIMRANGDEEGLLWATEAGASTCETHPHCVTEAEQARHVASYVRVARRYPYVRSMVIYNLRDKGTDGDNIEEGYGLVRSDLSPKPGLGALQRAMAEE